MNRFNNLSSPAASYQIHNNFTNNYFIMTAIISAKFANNNFVDSKITGAQFTDLEGDKNIFAGSIVTNSIVLNSPSVVGLNSITNLKTITSATDLSKHNLSYLNFSGMNLDKANMSNSILRYVNCTKCSLQEADLSGVDMSISNFSNAILVGAKLNKAILSDTNLDQADLTKVDLTGANIGQSLGMPKSGAAAATPNGM